MADEAAQTGNDTEPSKVAISVMAAMRRIEETEYISGSRRWNQLIFLTNVTEIISTTAGRKVTKLKDWSFREVVTLLFSARCPILRGFCEGWGAYNLEHHG